MTDADVASTATGPPPGMRVRLSSNESPFGPSPFVVEAVRDVAARAHIYPDDQSRALREALAEVDAVDVEQVTVGTGSTAVLMDTIAHATHDGGDVVAFEASFVVYRLAASNAGAPYVEVPIDLVGAGNRRRWRRDVERLLDAVTDDTRAVVIDNPGNPTGSHLTGDELGALVSGLPEHVTIIIDEAYHHFASGLEGYETVAALGLEHPRLVVVRTFSKAHALAGLRVGHATGPPDLIRAVDARRGRFNVTATAQAAALASLHDEAHLQRAIQGTLAGRERMATGLGAIGVPFIEGLGNFVVVDARGPAGPAIDRCARHGIGVRSIAPYGLPEHVRVSVGTPDEVDAFLAAAPEAFG
ncbi:MAG: aminotransferase class I/II-fold pyridoxal phosphate-dependent enzyme [Nitriliruptoraceae bacterium]